MLHLLQDLEKMSIIRFKNIETNDKNMGIIPKKQRTFGSMKGLVLYMAEDFNALLEDDVNKSFGNLLAD